MYFCSEMLPVSVHLFVLMYLSCDGAVSACESSTSSSVTLSQCSTLEDQSQLLQYPAAPSCKSAAASLSALISKHIYTASKTRQWVIQRLLLSSPLLCCHLLAPGLTAPTVPPPHWGPIPFSPCTRSIPTYTFLALFQGGSATSSAFLNHLVKSGLSNPPAVSLHRLSRCNGVCVPHGTSCVKVVPRKH